MMLESAMALSSGALAERLEKLHAAIQAVGGLLPRTVERANARAAEWSSKLLAEVQTAKARLASGDASLSEVRAALLLTRPRVDDTGDLAKAQDELDQLAREAAQALEAGEVEA